MKTLSKVLSAVLLLLLAAVPAVAQSPADELVVGLSKLPVPKVQTALDAALYDYQVFELETAKIDALVRKTGQVDLYLGNQRFDLVLEENNLRGENYKRILIVDGRDVELDAGPITTFKGHVAGDPESVVRMSITPDLVSGFLHTDGEMIFIDPVSDFARGTGFEKSVAKGDVVVYRGKNVRADKAGQCGTAGHHDMRSTFELPGKRGEMFRPLVEGIDTKTHQFRTLEVATDCDGQYFTRFGNPGSFNRMEGILNDVEGFIYTSELNLGINLVSQQCWPSAGSDPYTSLNAETTLNQLRNWWQANRSSVSRDVVHQFSGKDFSGGTIGIAWVGVICTNPSLSYGISQDISGSAARRRLTAHEIGHNLSAGHDNQAPVCSGVSCNGNGPIMCSFVQTGGSSAADDFSSCSFNSIDNHIDSFGGCI